MRYTLLRTFRFLLFLSFGVLVAGCQHPSASSSQQETERIDSLLDANKVVLFSDPAALNARLVQWQREVHDSVNWYKIETYRASALYRQGDTLQSQSLYRQVLDWCANRSDCKELTADVWNHQALHADQEGKVATALHCAGRAFRLLDGLPHKTDKLVRICINLADIHYRSGQIAEAARYFRRAQLLSDSLHYDALNSSIYTGLGQVSMELYDFKAAHRHFAQAARYLPDDDLFDFFFHYNTVGNCYYFEGRYREALVPFRKALAYAQQMENDCNQAIAYSNQAEIYLMLDSIPQASRMLRLAMKHYERSGQCPPMRFITCRACGQTWPWQRATSRRPAVCWSNIPPACFSIRPVTSCCTSSVSNAMRHGLVVGSGPIISPKSVRSTVRYSKTNRRVT